MTRSTTISFAIDWSIAIDALGTPGLDAHKQLCNNKSGRFNYSLLPLQWYL